MRHRTAPRNGRLVAAICLLSLWAAVGCAGTPALPTPAPTIAGGVAEQALAPAVLPTPTGATAVSAYPFPAAEIAPPVGYPAMPAASDAYPAGTDAPPSQLRTPALAGVVYADVGGVWLIGRDGAPTLLAAFPTVGLPQIPTALATADLSRIVYLEGGDIWLVNTADGATRNLTETPTVTECCLVQVQGETLLAGARETTTPAGAFGQITLIDLRDGRRSALDVFNPVGAPALSPDGAVVAYALAQPFRQALGGPAEPFDLSAYVIPDRATLTNFQSPAWSPDGRQIAWSVDVVGEDGRPLRATAVLDLAAQRVALYRRHTPAAVERIAAAAVWSPDGRYLIVENDELGVGSLLWLIDLEGGDEQAVGVGRLPVWRADGSAVLFSGSSGVLWFNPRTLDVQPVPLTGAPLAWVALP